MLERDEEIKIGGGGERYGLKKDNEIEREKLTERERRQRRKRDKEKDGAKMK